MAGALGPVCSAVADALDAFLRRLYPQAEVVRRFNTTAAHGVMAEDLAGGAVGDTAAEFDFALLTLAPVLVRAPGSFSLWAALARGKTGLVLSTGNPPPGRANDTSAWRWEQGHFGPNWRWVRAPLLTPALARRLGFVFEDAAPWIRWLEAH